DHARGVGDLHPTCPRIGVHLRSVGVVLRDPVTFDNEARPLTTDPILLVVVDVVADHLEPGDHVDPLPHVVVDLVRPNRPVAGYVDAAKDALPVRAVVVPNLEPFDEHALAGSAEGVFGRASAVQDRTRSPYELITI